MSSVPNILSSAQSLMSTGFSSLNRAAAAAAGSNGTLQGSSSGGEVSGNVPGNDPLLGSAIDVTSAREDVSAGVLLMRTSQRMERELMRSVDRNDPTDHYA